MTPTLHTSAPACARSRHGDGDVARTWAVRRGGGMSDASSSSDELLGTHISDDEADGKRTRRERVLRASDPEKQQKYAAQEFSKVRFHGAFTGGFSGERSAFFLQAHGIKRCATRATAYLSLSHTHPAIVFLRSWLLQHGWLRGGMGAY